MQLNGKMPNNERWVISSSRRHMFVRFSISYWSRPGFMAKIHHGNVINDIKIVHHPTNNT